MNFTPLANFPPASIRKFHERYVKVESGCWEWTSTVKRGYGRFKFSSTSAAAHRISYTISVGPIPPGMVIDHLCRNRKCVNPAHLEAVSQKENVFRGEKAFRLQTKLCAKGHPIIARNAMYQNKGAKPPICRECNRDYMRNYMKNYKGPKAA